MANDLLALQLSAGELISNFSKNTEKIGAANLTIDVLSNRLSLLETYWKSYLDRHLSLSAERESLKQEQYFTKDIFSEIEVTYVLTKTGLTQRLSTLIGELQATISPGTGAPARSTSMSVSTTASSLPKLQLPKFSGNQTDWDSFKSVFSSMVKDEPTLTPVLKLQHLLAALEGEGARRVCNLEVTEPNFDVAWNALLRRYDNKRLRLSVQINRLLSMSAATHSTRLSPLCLAPRNVPYRLLR